MHASMCENIHVLNCIEVWFEDMFKFSIVESFGVQVQNLGVCVYIPESGTRGRESLSFLPSLSDDGDGESWYSW